MASGAPVASVQAAPRTNSRIDCGSTAAMARDDPSACGDRMVCGGVMHCSGLMPIPCHVTSGDLMACGGRMSRSDLMACGGRLAQCGLIDCCDRLRRPRAYLAWAGPCRGPALWLQEVVRQRRLEILKTRESSGRGDEAPNHE